MFVPAVNAEGVRRVVGIDLSFTGTGVAALTLGDPAPAVRLIKSEGSRDATLAEQVHRHGKLSSDIITTVYGGSGVFIRPELVAIEGPALGIPRASDSSSFRRSAVWWQVVQTLIDDQVPVASVPPGSLKKFATGKGNAGKTAVALAVQRDWPDRVLSDDNVADALGLAMMAASHLGWEFGFRVTVARKEALRKVDWST
jgi:Holliday junction resolvasome RuvABC endonuclease subunit